ncbi:MAG: B12-binding domain-containing radical SAM protein [Candidatus Sericytochromatia bacterium]
MRIGFYAPCNEQNRQTGPLLGIAYIASYLREQSGIEDIFLEVDARRAMERKPDLLAISSFSEKYNQVSREVEAIRREHPDLPIVLGGPHISAMPHTLHPQINLGVIGEGEKPMASMVEIIRQEGRLLPERLGEVQNLVYWNPEGQLERTVFEDRIKDLDALPLPRRDIMKAWWPSLNEEVAFERGVYTSRGCSFRCHFCMYSERANLIRYVSIDKVMEDLLYIRSHHPEQKHIIFYDDLFVTKKSRLQELADAVRSEGLHKQISFGCMAKTSFFDEEFCQILKSMNIRVISWGFESGSERILQYLKDRHSTVRKHQKAMELCSRYGINAGGYFIIGSPPETRAELAQTYWFIRHNLPRLPLVGVYPVIPLPGTTLWQETARRGLIDDSFTEWDELGFLKLDEDSYLHLNENYPKEELKDAYENHFKPLMRWTNWIYPKMQDRHYLLENYFKQVLPQVRQAFAPGSRLLQLNRGDRSLTFALEEDYALTDWHWRDLHRLQEPDAPEFDGILLTHTVEKIGIGTAAWKQLQALNKPMYLLVEQVGWLPYLVALLRGEFPVALEMADAYQVQYRYSRATLLAALERSGFSSVHLDRFELPMPAQEAQELLELSRSVAQILPAQSYLQEAATFAYGVRVEPCASASST